jgi:hypothetical protein
MRLLTLLAMCALIVATPDIASAQTFGADARKVAMGGSGAASENIASSLVEKSAPYTVIVIPIGLIQVFKDGTDRFNPNSDLFDPVRAIEDASNPLHYTFGRGRTSTGQAFINDLVNGRVNPDLSTYAGFHIPTSVVAQGLASPSMGGTLKLARSTNAFQGVYLGAGPYLGFDTNLAVDPRLANLLGEGTRSANASMTVRNQSRVQLAYAVTVGYRGRVPLGASARGQRTRDGVYVAYNYHFLRGLRYLQPDLIARFDTNAAGNLALAPTTSPLSVVSIQGHRGTGTASDIGVQVVRGYFEAGFGVNGIGNHINWSDFTQTTYTLPSLTTAARSGQAFTQTRGVAPFTSLRIELPVVKTGNVGFRALGWGALASVTRGYNGTSFHGGVERQFGPLWLRGGGARTRGHWDPTYGVGIGDRVALDVGFYGTHANLEGRRQTSMAVSLRFGRPAR